ncbi:glycosyltransferase [Sorangium sp. So ce385]|uniref:glycosyltransferase n=1 Tax=Sorangium sp. So ce385 TaxID=3133308 RepID=UPI003F5B5D88
MSVATVIVSALLAASALYWLAGVATVVVTARVLRRLSEVHVPDRRAWPKISVIIPACDEAETLEGAMEAKLRDDYPNIEFVLVEDRSTDATAQIVDRIAARDGRIVAIHIEELPEGWLGKLHALERGAQGASGEWLLFSDADAHFERGTLRRAIAACERDGIDHLAVIPDFWPVSLLLDAVITMFVRIMCLGGRLWAIEDPASKAAIGSGAFNLVRREAYDRCPGFRQIRLEVADDVALGQILKRSGARSRAMSGRGAVGLRFYGSLGEMARGSEKNGYAVLGRCSLPRVVVACAALLSLELAPLLGLLPWAPAWLRGLGLCAAGLAFAASIGVARWSGRRVLPALLWPVGTALFVAMMLRAGWLGFRRGGIVWRGTLYPSETLRAGMRLDIMP